MKPDSSATVHRVRQLLDLQIRTTMPAFGPPSSSAVWHDYEQREMEIRELLDELDVASGKAYSPQ